MYANRQGREQAHAHQLGVMDVTSGCRLAVVEGGRFGLGVDLVRVLGRWNQIVNEPNQ